jgi:hypothetical protein
MLLPRCDVAMGRLSSSPTSWIAARRVSLPSRDDDERVDSRLKGLRHGWEWYECVYECEFHLPTCADSVATLMAVGVV